MRGYLIKVLNRDYKYRGPNEGILYLTEKGAQKALDQWPGIDGIVVTVEIKEVTNG